MSLRLLSLAAATTLCLTGFACAAPAEAVPAPAPVCSASTCVTTRAVNSPASAKQGGTVTITFDVLVAAGPANITSIVTQQTSGLTPDPASVTFDGRSVPATRSGHTLTINPTTLDPLIPQHYQLDYTATMAPASNADQTATAAVTFDDTVGGAPATSNSDPVQVQLQRPDFVVSEVKGPLSPLVAGGTANTYIDISGPGNAPAQLVLTEPAGFSIVSVTTDNGNVHLPCGRSGSTLTCTRNFRFDSVDLLVRADSTDRVGQTGGIKAVVNPVGIGDATPNDNTATVPLQVSGSVALSVVFSTPTGTKTVDNHIQTSDLPIGKPTTITMSVTNEGPDTATNVLGFLNLYEPNASHYAVSFGAGLDGHQASINNSTPYARWPIGTVRSGQTAVATITITPNAAGEKLFVGLYMQSNQYNRLQCDGGGQACNDSGALDVTTVNAVTGTPTPTGTAPTSTTSSTDPTLANTGAPARAPLVAGLLTLLIGGAFVLVGRRRRA